MSSVAVKQSAFSQHTGDVWLVLLTIEHPDIDPSIRVVNNSENVVSRGNEFINFWFEPILPDSRDDSPSRARLAIDNVSREIAEAIRSISTPPTVLLEIVRADDPDTVEYSWPFFYLRNVRWDVNQVTGDLVLEDFADEPYPSGRFTPASFPGLF